MSRHSAKLDNLLKYLTAAILLVIPLYPKFPLINIPGTYVSIRFEDFVIALGGLVLVKLIYSDYRNFFIKRSKNSIVSLYYCFNRIVATIIFRIKNICIFLFSSFWFSAYYY